MSTYRMVGGLDPSLSNFGMSKGMAIYGRCATKAHILTIDEVKLVTTKSDKSIKYKNLDDLQRAYTLGKEMMDFFTDVDDIYVEIPHGSQSARAMASYGICVGIIASLGKRVIRVSAKDVKEAATGDVEASKQDMINWATNLYPDLPWLTKKQKGVISFTGANEHIADSLAAIHAGLGLKRKSNED